MNDIFDNPEDAFWTGHPMDLFFNGIPLNCSSENFNTRAFCTVLESGEQPQIQQVDEFKFKFSIFGAVIIMFSMSI